MSRDSQSPSKARGRWEYLRQWFSNFSGLRPSFENGHSSRLAMHFLKGKKAVERVGYVLQTNSQNCVDILCSKLTLNEESSEKSIISPSAFVDMPVRTTSACCEKPDRNMILRSSVTESLTA
ncbi:hypothetical protein T01_3644 [Trichinella spiralis]|uniref:Uncharacterized protein n=1 Tax=Trichinella spiralis TaxID=6334 RepID=A0A0V1BHG3_TRISP|nr:hypothetical protein T01_3644 [Trichinella spiralis]